MPRPLKAAEDMERVLSKAATFFKGADLSSKNWFNKREPNSFDGKVRQRAIDFCKRLSNEELGALTRHLRSAASRMRLDATYWNKMMEELGEIESEPAYQIAGVGVILFWYEQKVMS